MAEPLILGLSIASGSTLFLCAILFGWILLNYYNTTSSWFLWILMPIISYVLAFGWNSISQKVSCGSINPGQVASNSVFAPVFMLGGLGLAKFLSGPVVNSIPTSFQGPMAAFIAIGFYAFWAGMFGTAISAGLSQSCGTAT
jgi:hypothetical protein